MGKIIFTFLALLAVALVAAQKPDPKTDGPIAKGPRRRAVVMGFEIKVQGVTTTAPTPSGTTTVVNLDISQPADFGTGMADMLVTALTNSGRFVVLDRQNLEDIQKEQALTKTPDFDQKSAIEAGKLLGAQVIVRGAVTELNVKKSGSGVGGLVGDTVGFSQAKSEATVGIDLKIVDATTGEVIQSVKATGKVTSKTQSFTLNSSDIKLGAASFESSVLGEAVRKAIEDAVAKVVKNTETIDWQAQVATVTGEGTAAQIYINVGADSGLKVGDILEIDTPGEEIRDNDTDTVIGFTKGQKIGECRVTELQKKLTIAAATEGAGFARGNVVKFISHAKP